MFRSLQQYNMILTRCMVIAVLLMLSVAALRASHISYKDSIIDVPRFMIASWYRGIDRDTFDNPSWYSNTSFTFTVNPELMWDKASYDHNLFNFGMSLNKDLNTYSTLSAGFSFANSDKSDYRFRRFGADFGYIWNLTNFYYGLDLSRRYYVSATTGLEMGAISDAADKKQFYYGGYLGLRLARVFSPHTSFFIEPRLGLYSDAYDAADNADGFDAMATAHLGLNYKLSEMLANVPPRKAIEPLHQKNWYFEIGADALLPIPKSEYEGEGLKYSDNINYGTSIGVGYRANPLTSARARFTYAKNHKQDVRQYMAALDILLSGTNIFLGENSRRYVDMSLVLGPLFQLDKIKSDDKLHFSWGAEAGLQFTRRITPTWELFMEPRLQIIQDYTKTEKVDSDLKKRWDLNLGMVYLYQKRTRQPHNSWIPLRNWYVQSLLGAQVSSLSSGHQLGSFDLSVGRNFGPLWSVRASIFSGELQSEEADYDEISNPMYVTYFGGRAEIVLNFLRMWSPTLEDSRWNWNLSGGAEIGHLSNHHHKDIAIVAGSQVQYRFAQRTWLTAGARVQQPLEFEAKLPLSAHLGLQYDINNEKRTDLLYNYWRWYVQGGLGFHNAFFNMDELSYGAAVGLNVTPVHGGRIEFIGTKIQKADDGSLTNWMSLSPEYVFNFTNRLLGEDDRRKLDIEFFSGLDIMMHKKPKLGFNLGAQLNAYVTDNFAFYVEPRFSIQPFDKVIAPTSHDKVQYATMLGVRYVHDRFYTKNNDAAYVDLWHGKEFRRLNDFFYRVKQWRPFENWHPGRDLKEKVSNWHPMQNIRQINRIERNNQWHPMQKWYIQTNWSAQLSSLTSGHQIGSFDFAIGRKLGNLFSVQASVFSGELLSEEQNINDTDNPMFVSYYGGRAEMVFNFLRLFSPAIVESRWNWNVSGGVEMGHLTNHHNNDFAIVATSQLQYRIGKRAWISAGGRVEKLNKFDAKLPLSGLLGIQYDFSNDRRIDILANRFRWYVQTNSGFRRSFFNMDNLVYGGAFGMNVTPRHGFRIGYLGTEKNQGADGTYYNWMSLSPEYVFNLTNHILGEDDKRRVDMELFAGLDLVIHNSSILNSQTRVGYNFGTQINANITKSISLFIQPRFSYLPNDKIHAPTSHDKLQYFTLFGIRYSHNRFKSMKQ